MPESTFTTEPKISMETQLWYSTDEAGTDLTQIRKTQEIPTLQGAPEPVTYGCLEDNYESQTKGRRKAETIAIPILYLHEQHKALKALEKSNTPIWFFVKLPDSTAPSSGKALTFKFRGTIALTNDSIGLDGMLQETMTIYKETDVTELDGLPEQA